MTDYYLLFRTATSILTVIIFAGLVLSTRKTSYLILELGSVTLLTARVLAIGSGDAEKSTIIITLASAFSLLASLAFVHEEIKKKRAKEREQNLYNAIKEIDLLNERARILEELEENR